MRIRKKATRKLPMKRVRTKVSILFNSEEITWVIVMQKRSKMKSIRIMLMVMRVMKVEPADRIFFLVSIHKPRTILLHQRQTTTKNSKIKMLSHKISKSLIYPRV